MGGPFCKWVDHFLCQWVSQIQAFSPASKLLQPPSSDITYRLRPLPVGPVFLIIVPYLGDGHDVLPRNLIDKFVELGKMSIQRLVEA